MLARHPLGIARIFTRSGQIAHSLIVFTGDINVGQLPGTVQSGESHGVTTVVFDSLPNAFRRVACWSGNDGAVKTFGGQITVKLVTARPCFIHKVKLLAGTDQFAEQSTEGI